MNTYFSLLLSFFCLTLSAQSKLTPAQWTNPNGVKSDILISFGQWEITPNVIKYKTSDTAPEQTLAPSQVSMLRVLAQTEERYIGRETPVAEFSRSPSANYSINRTNKSIFLQTLVEGRLSLYKYQDENRIVHFFIQMDTSWEELIFHTYFVDSDQKIIRQHTKYQTSLLRATLDCPSLADRIRQSVPGERSFVDIITSYNTTPCPGILTFKQTKIKGKLRIGLRLGGAVTYNQTAFDYSRPYSGQHTFLQPKVALGFQYILPRRNGSRSVLLEFLYDKQAYETQAPVPTRITQNYFQTSLSVRRRFGVKAIKPFLNAGLVFGIPTGTARRTYGWPLDYSPASQSGMSIGAGLLRMHWELETRFVSHHLLGFDRKGVNQSLAGMVTFAVWL
ncbi:MAG: hypothetical protein JNN28_01815 [Saprospiraceae bacterium]|nr:hypothetical protein [Saprospiraceae bacterium]